MKTLVVALARSACTGEVLDEALALCPQSEPCRLVLLHVVQPLAAAPADQEEDPTADLIQSARRWLAPFVAKVSESRHHVLSRVEHGEVVGSILAVAEEQRATGIVMGSRERTGIARLVLGSTAKAVARRARCTTHLVRHTWRPSCTATSCQWCEDSVDPLRARLQAEAEG